MKEADHVFGHAYVLMAIVLFSTGHWVGGVICLLMVTIL